MKYFPREMTKTLQPNNRNINPKNNQGWPQHPMGSVVLLELMVRAGEQIVLVAYHVTRHFPGITEKDT